MGKFSTIIKSSILAGICIGIAGFGFLALGGVVGAVMFAFGLITVVCYKLKLYTGTAGFIEKGQVGDLLLILVGNILGCLLVALLARVSPMPLQQAPQPAQALLEILTMSWGPYSLCPDSPVPFRGPYSLCPGPPVPSLISPVLS